MRGSHYTGSVLCCVSRDPVTRAREPASYDFLKDAKCIKSSRTTSKVHVGVGQCSTHHRPILGTPAGCSTMNSILALPTQG